MSYFTLRSLCTLVVFAVPCGVASAQTYAVSNALVHDNLAVYAVRGEGGGARAPMALEQALAGGAVRIHAENLRELTVENFSDTPVFVQFGDLLRGGTQDQVAAESLLVRPRSHATLNVFCVDPFRSTARSGEDPEAFTASANLLPSPVAELAMLTSSSTATAKRPSSSRELRQLAIWWSIDTLGWALSQRLGHSLAIASGPIPQQGSAMRQYVDQLLRARRSPSMQSLPLDLGDPRVVSAVGPYVESIEPAIVSDDKIVGAVFAVNGRLVAAEIYQSNELFRQMMPKLLRAYATEAIAANTGAEEPPSTDAVRSFLEAAHHEPPLHDTFSGEFHVSDANSTTYSELSGADGWVHRSYLNKVRSGADALAPEAVILRMLETGRINSRSIDDITRQDRVILERDASSGRWSATIQSMPPRHSPAFNIGLLLILFVLPSVAEALLIRRRSRRNRARLLATQGSVPVLFDATPPRPSPIVGTRRKSGSRVVATRPLKQVIAGSKLFSRSTLSLRLASARSQPSNVSAAKWPCLSDILILRSMRWLSRAAISGLLVSAWAVADAHRGAAAGGVELMLDMSSPGNRGARNAERIRLLARIRETGRRDQVPDEVIKALIEIVSDDVDLQRAAQPGDGFRIQYRDTAGGATEISFVSLTYGCDKRTFYRFVDADGVADYYDENGRSARKKLLRNPVEAGLLVGRFGYREPLWTKRSTFHHGVDWWAARSAPVHAAGDGLIEATRSGSQVHDHWLVLLRHNDPYQTRYQLATLAAGVRPGQRVRQGQVIGFSDARTDTTVHYEVLVNDRFFDPMRIRLPAEKHLHDQELADFQDEAAKIAALAEQEAPFHSIYTPPK